MRPCRHSTGNASNKPNRLRGPAHRMPATVRKDIGREGEEEDIALSIEGSRPVLGKDLAEV